MNEAKETGRIEAFSDGVFAVAITLLVLDIKVPPVPPASSHLSLASALLQQWPMYLAFTTSFLTILIMWINHHRVFSLISRSNDTFLLLNGLLLMTVTIIPFSTSLLAAYLTHRDAMVAAAIYSGSNVALALSFNALWKYASDNNRLLARSHDKHMAESITKAFRFGPHLYLAAFVLAFFNYTASIGLCMLLAAFFTIPPRKVNAVVRR